MSYTTEDVFTIADRLRFTLTASQALVTELKTALASLDLPTAEEVPRYSCSVPHCGFSFSSKVRLVDHRRNVHGEDIPLEEVTA
jgi:hypothetical protein